MLPAWLSFIIIIIGVMALSKYELGIILSLGSVAFALLAGVNPLQSLFNVLTDPTIIILIIIMTLIPILGGILEESGLMMDMIQKMRISKKTSLMAIPALFGLLPVAGGALMSAPIVDQIDSEADSNVKVSINIWFRHMLIIIYPLSSTLILASILTNIDLYVIVLGLMPGLIVMWLIGYFILIKDVTPYPEQGERDLKRAFHNMIPIIIAPIVDFVGRTFFNLSVPEIYLLIALFFSIFVALRFSNMKFSAIKSISKRIFNYRLQLLSPFIWFKMLSLSCHSWTLFSYIFPFHWDI